MDDRFQPVKNHVTRTRRVGNVKIWDLLPLCLANRVTRTLRGDTNVTSALGMGNEVTPNCKSNIDWLCDNGNGPKIHHCADVI